MQGTHDSKIRRVGALNTGHKVNTLVVSTPNFLTRLGVLERERRWASS